MPKKTYVGVNNKAKNVPSKGYIGITNKAKKLLKGYIGDANGKARLFWGKKVGNFWFFYETVANKTCQRIDGRNYYKRQNGIAFYAITHHVSRTGNWFNPLYVSTDEDAVRYWTSGGGTTFPHGSFEYNGETWYWEGNGHGFVNQTYSPAGCFIDLGNNRIDSIDEWIGKAADILMPNIYTDDFAEDYKIGQTYNLRLGNIEKTIRKAIAVFLFKSVYLKASTHYNVLLENVDNFVNDLLTYAGDSKSVEFRIFRGYGDIIQLTAFYSSDVPDNKNITNKRGAYYYFYYTYNSAIQADKGYRMIQIANDGTITKSGSSSNAGNMSNYIGLYLNKSTISGVTYTTIYLSNIGLNL